MANNEMTNGLKAREIANCNKCPYNKHRCKHNKDTWCHEYRMTLEMAQWKDEQFAAKKHELIDNACKFLKDNFETSRDIISEEGVGICESKDFIEIDEMIDKFRKAMEKM